MSDNSTNDKGGVKIDMIGSSRMEELGTAEKIDLIIQGVRKGKIVILESGLEPAEESQLIEQTMGSIEPDEFEGIEIESYPTGKEASGGFMNKLLSREEKDEGDKLTVIGPANCMETIKKDESLISTVINPL